MPGTLARHYAAAGGEVVLMGKPAPVIYAAALEMLQLPAHQVIAVGDSLEHDIGGAAAAGVASCFVLGGIHADDVALAPAQQQQADGSASSHAGGDTAAAGGYTYSRQRLAEMCAAHGVEPTCLLSFFSN